MSERVLDISESPAELSLTGECLLVGVGGERHRVALVDLAAVVLGHPRSRVTTAALAACAAAGVPVIVCDEKYSPAGMLSSLTGHGAQTLRFREQIASPLPRRKRAWQALVKAKVLGQAWVLRGAGADDDAVRALAAKVRSGDPANVEAQAARKYWSALFGELFRRERTAEDQNQHLNYGYAVLRSSTARALAGSGLNLSFGVHHHHRNDAFCLADDVMEPFRPVVDAEVHRLVLAEGALPELTSKHKERLVAAALGRVETESGLRTIPDTLGRLAASLHDLLAGRGTELFLPIWP